MPTKTAKTQTKTASKPAAATAKPAAKPSTKPAAKAKDKPETEAKAEPKSKPAEPAAPMTARQITNYATALKWLYEHGDHEKARTVRYDSKTFSLERMRDLLKHLGDPHLQVKCVQVAGTKGKGSTCTMLASMLEGCGYTVGLYTSPHLTDLRERITINTAMVPMNDLTEIFREIAKVEAKLKHPPTFFEVMTAAAFKYFAEQAVDLVILETGLGGRLDATTVATPLVTAITQISYDHMNLLGQSLPQIAREKAGILKKGVPALTIEQSPEVEAVLRECAEAGGTRLELLGKEVDFSWRFEANKELGPHTRVCLLSERSKFEHLAVPLKGEHQALNCGLALAILDRLRPHGFDCDEARVATGLAATRLHGRMEEVWNHPKVIIDGAHNAASIQALMKAMGAHLHFDSSVMIFGCSADKDIGGMLQQASLGADKIIFTKASTTPRAVEPKELRERFDEIAGGKMCQIAENLTEALKIAARACHRDDLILITGSFYLAGEARQHFMNLSERRQGAK